MVENMIKIDPETHRYPDIEPYRTGFLPVDDLHTIYYEESGNPEGQPVVRCHGGPGAASKGSHRTSFDPEQYRIILFDQRGCGQSTPAGELQHNTTLHSLADMEALRSHLGIETWHVFGGSWGSALALLYAETYPERVRSLVVYGIFLAEKWAYHWLSEKGLGYVYPDAYADLCRALPADNDEERLALCHDLLARPHREDHLKVAAFAAWEACGMTMFPELDEPEPPMTREDEDQLIQYIRTFMHYEKHAYFMDDGQILKNAHRLKDIPGAIIQGRFDLCCPVKGAWDLHQAWPEADFEIVHHASHRTEPPLNAALAAATNKMATLG